MQLRQLRGVMPEGPLLQEVTDRAVEAVLARARDLLRHAARPTDVVLDRWPADGELDVERTLEQPPRHRDDGRRSPWDPEDLCLERRQPRDVDVCAVLDMSLSMTGEKIALIAVAAAILRLKLDRVGVVAFDTVATPLVHVGEAMPVRELVRRVLTVPARGYTHIAAGLECGLEELQRSRRRERVGLLLSDAIANVGADPVTVAGRYRGLHVVHLGRALPQGTRCSREMALAGRGRRFHAPTFMALPLVIKQVIREVFRV